MLLAAGAWKALLFDDQWLEAKWFSLFGNQPLVEYCHFSILLKMETITNATKGLARRFNAMPSLLMWLNCLVADQICQSLCQRPRNLQICNHFVSKTKRFWFYSLKRKTNQWAYISSQYSLHIRYANHRHRQHYVARSRLCSSRWGDVDNKPRLNLADSPPTDPNMSLPPTLTQ